MPVVVRVPPDVYEERIANFAAGLKAENDRTSTKDAADLEKTLRLVQAGKNKEYDQLQELNKFYGNMDTSVRDTFMMCYTNHGKDKKAVVALRKVLPDWGIFEDKEMAEAEKLIAGVR